MTLATDTVHVPFVRLNLSNPKGTNRPIFAPIYEQPLLEKLWENSGYEVEVGPIPEKGPNGRAWPKDMLGMDTTEAEEEQRLKKKYGRNPSTKEPIYDAVYAFGRFHEAFDRCVSGAWGVRGQTANPTRSQGRQIHPAMAVQEQIDAEEVAEAPAAEEAEVEAEVAEEVPAAEEAEAPANEPGWKALTPVKGLGDELAQALFEDGIVDIAEVASMSVEEIKKYPGVGEKSGEKIIASASELTLADMEG